MGRKPSSIVPLELLSRRTKVHMSAALVDFNDRESQRVLVAAASAVARELGREAAREYFAELIGKPKVP